MRVILLCVLASLVMAGCDVPQPSKPLPYKPRVNGEQQLRDALAHTNPQTRRQ